MYLFRHIPFLKAVFLHGISAFGGPQAHIALLMKYFVKKRREVTESELLELNAFCQLLPGASSSQTILLIGYKRGGPILALLSLLVWILPVSIIMCAFSFLVEHMQDHTSYMNLFRFMVPMAAGFLIYACIIAIPYSVKNKITLFIALGAAIPVFVLFGKPFIIPLLIILGGFITNLSKKRIPDNIKPAKTKIIWNNLWIFILLFVLAGATSELARKNEWSNRKPIHLFENTYRMGSLVFGGGNVLMPMMYEQFSVRPNQIKEKNPNAINIDKKEMLTGFGLVRAMPGPVFSVASYTGGLALKDMGVKMQLLGGLIGMVAIFLPSALLAMFFYPIWNKIKKYAVIYRSLEGINAVIMGVLIGSTLYIMKDISILDYNYKSFINIIFIAATPLILLYTKLPPPLLVAISMLLGYFL